MHPTEGNVEHFTTSVSRKTSGVAKKVSEFLAGFCRKTRVARASSALKKNKCVNNLLVHVARTSKDFELWKSKLPEGSSRQAPLPSRAPSNSKCSIRSKKTQIWIVPKIQTMDGHERALQTSGRQTCYCLCQIVLLWQFRTKIAQRCSLPEINATARSHTNRVRTLGCPSARSGTG